MSSISRGRAWTKTWISPSGIPSFRIRIQSDGAEHGSEDGLLAELGGKALEQRQQLVLEHIGDELIKHGALAEQRVGAPLGGAGPEHAVIAEFFACGAEQGQPGDGEGVDQPEAVT